MQDTSMGMRSSEAHCRGPCLMGEAIVTRTNVFAVQNKLELHHSHRANRNLPFQSHVPLVPLPTPPHMSHTLSGWSTRVRAHTNRPPYLALKDSNKK